MNEEVFELEVVVVVVIVVEEEYSKHQKED